MKEKIRIGIIGSGFARTVQIPAFQKIAGAEIVSIASARREKAEQTAAEFGIAHYTDDWRETVRRKDVDLICITTPPVFHCEMTLFALENNKNILCEKPTAMNAAEALKMFQAAKAKNNLLTLIDHELRFLNGRKKAFEMIRAGNLGKIRHAKYNFRAPHRGDSSLPWTWWSDETQGGGALGAIGSHVFDTLRWMTGAEISKIFCQLQTHVKDRRDERTGEMREVTTDDEANLILRFADGEFTEDATANVSLSMVEYPIYQNRVEIFGTKGAVRVEFDGELFVGEAGKESWQKLDLNLNEAVEGVRNTGWNNGFLAFATEIVEALREGKTSVENGATFEDGYKIQVALDAARESSRTGKMISLD